MCAVTTLTHDVSRLLLQHQQLVQQLLRKSDSDLAAAVSTLRSDISGANAAAAAAAQSIDTLAEATRSRVAAVEAACGSICKETLMQGSRNACQLLCCTSRDVSAGQPAC